MSISADPLFVAAEAAWRRESLAAGFPQAAGPQHHSVGIRAALAVLAHPHRLGRHGGRKQGRHGTPRIA